MDGVTKAVLVVAAAMILSSPLWRLEVECRGIMVEPPHRSSLWRYNYNVSMNLKDDSLNCGGYDWQWRIHQGRCGVCGDLFNGTQDNSDRGKYDKGIIVRRYKDGHYINITFEVSSNYLGYVEFRLCPRNSTRVILDQSCFDRYPLWIDESHGTRYYIGSRGGIYDIHIRLPSGLVCKRCVLQWKYKTGYRYNGNESCKCLGCGRQEQYVNCADIEIAPLDGWPKVPRRGRTDKRTLRPQGIRTGRTHMDLNISPQTRGSTDNNFTIAHPKATILYGASTTKTIANFTGAQNISSNETTKSKSNITFATTLSPSYLSPEAASQIIPTPRAKSINNVSITPWIPRKVMPLEDIRRELLKRVGGAGATLFMTPPKNISTTPVSKTPRVDTSVPKSVTHVPPAVPNTQFVSVSNILERFYPNYMTPFLFSLTKTRGTMLKLPPGCEVTSDEFRCVARGIYNQSPGISTWCEMNCRANNCVMFMCDCFCEDKRRIQNSSCHAIAEFHGVEGMDQWCTANCKVGYCPSNTCSVEDCLRPPDVRSNGEA